MPLLVQKKPMSIGERSKYTPCSAAKRKANEYEALPEVTALHQCADDLQFWDCRNALLEGGLLPP